MAKAYDRVQWPFLIKVLRRMGFSEKWLGLVERCINSCWFSVLVNGTSAGFFKSSRGLRQGDPLSPSLFILAAEYLSRSLDRLILGRKEMRFTTTRYNLEVSHLAYADDVIVFTQAKQTSLQELVECLRHYAAVSGQRINTEKSQFYVDEKHAGWSTHIEAIGGFQRGTFPFTYLGVPIFKGRKKTDMFRFLREKISARIHSWSHRFLSFGGRLTLIKSTLGAIPLHVFQVLEPTRDAMKQMESLIARFFWGSTQDKKATHWINWEQACHPVDEGGLGIRRFEEMVKAFGMKLWVRFREQNSLWARFMWKKYCREAAPSKAPFTGKQSIVRKRMARAGAKIHKYIVWALGDGEIHFWEDIWWGDRPLSDLCNPGIVLPHHRVKDFWVNGEWNMPMLHGELMSRGVPEEVIKGIGKTPIESGGRDTLRWSCSAHGDFTTSSAWELCRHRLPHTPVFKLIWNEHVLPSISIFIWRLLANRIPVDAKLQWRKISLASKCRCCRAPDVETRVHLFLQGEVAAAVWEKVSAWFSGLPRWNANVSNMEARIRFWHRRLCESDKPHVSALVPCLVLWFLWSERNGSIHRSTRFTAESVFNRVKLYLQQLISAGKLGKEQWRGCDTLNMFNTSAWKERPRTQIKLVRWIPPDANWIKLNTAGIWKPAEAGAGGIVRDTEGNILRGFMLKVTADSALDAELQALSTGLDYARVRGQKLWIELDAMEVVSMVRSSRFGAASLRHRITEIRNKLKSIAFKISHMPRQGNKAAGWLALQGCNGRGLEVFRQDSAPAMVKALARMDQMGMPNFGLEGQDGNR